MLIAGSNYFKPGQHDDVAACTVLIDLLKQTDGIAPVLAVDWPKKSETLAGAKAIVLFLDGGDKHPLIQKDRFAEIQKLVESGTGLVQLHLVNGILWSAGREIPKEGAPVALDNDELKGYLTPPPPKK